MQTDTAHLLSAVRQLANQAAAAVMEIYRSGDFDVRHKADDSPLTRADVVANDIITAGLGRLTPTVPIVSEEALIPAADRVGKPAIWLVDPIDGTKEFIKQNGQFTINIGLVEHSVPVLGVVLAPALGLEYYGSAAGAYKVDSGLVAQAANRHANQRLRQKTGQKISVFAGRRPLIAVGSLSHPGPAAAEWLARQQVAQTIAVGSSLKVCYVADGTADVYPRLDAHLHEWDIAAADAVLRAAGGICRVAESGQAVVYNQADLQLPHFIISGPAFSQK